MLEKQKEIYYSLLFCNYITWESLYASNLNEHTFPSYKKIRHSADLG